MDDTTLFVKRQCGKTLGLKIRRTVSLIIKKSKRKKIKEQKKEERKEGKEGEKEKREGRRERKISPFDLIHFVMRFKKM